MLGWVACIIESLYEKFQACLIIYDKVVSVFVSMPSGCRLHMPSVGDVTPAQPKKLFSAEGAKRIDGGILLRSCGYGDGYLSCKSSLYSLIRMKC